MTTNDAYVMVDTFSFRFCFPQLDSFDFLLEVFFSFSCSFGRRKQNFSQANGKYEYWISNTIRMEPCFVENFFFRSCLVSVEIKCKQRGIHNRSLMCIERNRWPTIGGTVYSVRCNSHHMNQFDANCPMWQWNRSTRSHHTVQVFHILTTPCRNHSKTFSVYSF